MKERTKGRKKLPPKHSKNQKRPQAAKSKKALVSPLVATVPPAEPPAVSPPPPLIEPTPLPAPKKAPSKLYFNSDTQVAIVEFQTCVDRKRKEELYVKTIMPAFSKLTENLINIHKFSSLYDSYDDLKSDCVNFLFETIQKFDSTRGTNAFSYFNVVAKNWLIIRTKQKMTKIKRNVSLDDAEALSHAEQRIIEEHCTIPAQDVLLENKNTARAVASMLYEIRDKAKTENELACVNAIITIFQNIDELDILTKSSTLLYMRELSGLTPKQLTMTLQSLKRNYRRLKLDAKFRIF